MKRQLHHCSFCKSFRFTPEYAEGYPTDYGDIECLRRPGEEVYMEMPILICGWFAPKSKDAAIAEAEWLAQNAAI